MTELGGIEHLILLDLLGAPQPLIRSYFIDTAWLFDSLVSVERRLGESGAFAYGAENSMSPGKWTSYFRPRTPGTLNYGHVGDDHVPFLQKGVSVLHLITEPFPSVWHRLSVSFLLPVFCFRNRTSMIYLQDDASALDLPTLRRWNIMLRIFIAEYLNLRPHDFPSSRTEKVIKRSDSELVSACTYPYRWNYLTFLIISN